MKPSLETAQKQQQVIIEKSRIDRIEAMMRETSKLSGEISRAHKDNPAPYALNRAWRALEKARNLLR